jgi:prepilin-type N-terminal cleavage/methylation domain-containing protein
VKRRNGFSLVETMIVLVIAGILFLIGLPRMRQGMAQSNVRGARTTVVNMLARARAGATQTGRRTWLKFEGTTAIVLARPRRNPGAGDADTLGAIQNLTTQYGVTVTTSVDSIQFDPRGLASGFASAGATITVAKGSHSNLIKVDALGRITQ